MIEGISNPWEIAEADFPVAGNLTEQLCFLLNYAVLAPSRHNSQPWLFRVDEHGIEVYADRSRRLPVVDADDRELTISCGAALANLLIALHHFGYATSVEIHADADHPDLLARLSHCGSIEAADEEHLLFQAIQKRRTNRRLFEDREVPASLISEIEDIAMREGTGVRIIRGKEARSAVTNLIARADQLLWTNQRYRQELAAWTRPDQDQRRDGVPQNALGRQELMSSLGPPLLHTLIAEDEEVAHAHDMVPGSPLLVVLSTFADSWFDWLAVGQALEKILLRACSDGIYASFFNQPIEVAPVRNELRNFFGRGEFPQIVLRMGYGPDVPPTPRRWVREVLL